MGVILSPFDKLRVNSAVFRVAEESALQNCRSFDKLRMTWVEFVLSFWILYRCGPSSNLRHFGKNIVECMPNG